MAQEVSVIQPTITSCPMHVPSHHLPGFAHAGTFHQLDVDARKGALQACHILQTLDDSSANMGNGLC